MDLISEARKRGYQKGTAIRYVPHAVDYVEGDFFEIVDGELRAYAKPEHERKCFEDWRCDTLYKDGEWVEFADLGSRTKEQIEIDKQHNIY